MTSANVFNLGSVNQGQTLNANAGTGKTKAENPEVASVFSSMMNANYSTNPTVVNAGKKVFSWSADTGSEFERYQYGNRDIGKADQAAIADKVGAASEELDTFQEKVVQTVAEELGVDEETVMTALKDLGMTVFDLLNPQNLAQLVMQLGTGETAAELLTNSQFLDLMQSVADAGMQLMDELGLAPDQMEELIAQMDVLEKPEELSGFSDSVVNNADTVLPEGEMAVAGQKTVLTQQTGLMNEGETEPENADKVTVSFDEDAYSAKPEMSDGKEQQNASGEFPKSDAQPETVDTQRNTHSTKEPLEQVFVTAGQAAQEMVAQVADTDTSYLSIDTMDLIQQIAEQVKVNISEGTTSMEMQLNPENLGRIYLQISAKEGTVHAMIAAQNEAVRTALESQVAELRESLNQSGVKVDAIEVTIASHEFEKNLEQNQNREKEQGERQQEQLSHRRSINLSSLDELSSVMTEEETLIAQMMRDNGNSVDLTV